MPDEHAEPLDTHIPLSSNFRSNSPPFTFENEKLAFPGNLFTLSPFNLTSFMFRAFGTNVEPTYDD